MSNLDIDKIMREDTTMSLAFQSLTGEHQMKYWQGVLSFAQSAGLANEDAEAGYHLHLHLSKQPVGDVLTSWLNLVDALHSTDELLDLSGILASTTDEIEALQATRKHCEGQLRELGVYNEREHGRVLFDAINLAMLDPMSLGVDFVDQHKQMAAHRKAQAEGLRFLVNAKLGR